MAKAQTISNETALTAVPTNNLVSVGTQMPAHLMKNAGRGNEDVGANHLTIPRVKLLQKMSDEIDRHHANYVPGSKDGDFLNSLTGENYGESIYVITLKFKDKHVVWRNRDAGGGLLGSYDTEVLAKQAVAAQEKPADYDITQTHEHLVLLKDPTTGELSRPVLMDFSSSKLKVSRNWNSQIVIKGGDRFAGLWKLSSVPQKNKAGAQYMNIGVEFVGWTTEQDFLAAEKYFQDFAGA